MLEWLKRHAWKACKRQKCFRGSNPRLSAKILLQAAEVSLLTNADWSKRFAQDVSGRLWGFGGMRSRRRPNSRGELQAAEVSLLTNADWSKRFAQDASGRLWGFGGMRSRRRPNSRLSAKGKHK